MKEKRERKGRAFRQAKISLAVILSCAAVFFVTYELWSHGGERQLFYLSPATAYKTELYEYCDVPGVNFYFNSMIYNSTLSYKENAGLLKMLRSLKTGQKEKMSGDEKYDRLRRTSPQLKVKLITGGYIYIDAIDDEYIYIGDSFYKITDENKEQIKELSKYIKDCFNAHYETKPGEKQ